MPIVTGAVVAVVGLNLGSSGVGYMTSGRAATDTSGILVGLITALSGRRRAVYAPGCWPPADPHVVCSLPLYGLP